MIRMNGYSNHWRFFNMTIIDVLTLIGGLCLFLFGMNIMGQALERRAGPGLRNMLERMTTGKISGFLTGCGITAVIQSSSATTVMVVGFVNSGLMTLKQAINVIMGSNVGTTITAWILSLSGISSDNIWVQLLKPSSFVPIIALLGIILFMFVGKGKHKDTGMILLGFATLMFGMETMSSSVSGLADIPAFRQLFLLFENPLLGVLAGAVLTAIIQSSSASVGILQALAMTGQVSYGAAVPILMGDSIGTCVTALLSSVGAKKEAKRAAMAHLCFNVIGAAVWITVFCVVRALLHPVILSAPASLLGIAVVNTMFKVLSTALLLPMSSLLEKLVTRLVPDRETEEEVAVPELDERLLATPSLAFSRCESTSLELAQEAKSALDDSIYILTGFSQKKDRPDFAKDSAVRAERIKKAEERTDLLEDAMDSFLVKLSAKEISEEDNEWITAIMKITGDYERIADHSLNLLEAAERMQSANLTYTEEAQRELKTITDAVSEVMALSLQVLREQDPAIASKVEPLEQVVDQLKETLRDNHIRRMKNGKCSMEAGIIWADILTDLERISDHCSNIAGCILDLQEHTMNIHENQRFQKQFDPQFKERFVEYQNKYKLSY